MTYADVEKAREANRLKQARHRERVKGVTERGVTPQGVTTHLERSWRGVAKAQAEGTLEAIVKGVVAKGHGGLVRWGCSGPLLQDVASVFLGAKALPEDADVMGPMADEFTDEELEAHRKVRERANVLVIGKLPKAQQDELYRGLAQSYGRRGIPIGVSDV
jgi:hypothetical protein